MRPPADRETQQAPVSVEEELEEAPDGRAIQLRGPVKDHSALANLLGEAKILSLRRQAKVV